ncbi:MAG: ribonuclease III [Acidobacteriota bacterium]
MATNLGDLEQALGHVFTDRGLLVRALTHSSSANEKQPLEGPVDNERLEFLGDSVLGWLVSEWLFRRFSDFTEGQLSLLKNHLVSAAHLLAAAHRLDLGRYLHLGRGEETAGGRTKQRLLVNAFEAVLAAVYLDAGPGPVREILLRYSMPDDDELMRLAGAGPPQDFRAELERISRDRNLPRPQYVLLGEGGPGHARTFLMEVRVGKEIAVSAEGSSKKTAAHNAAREICRMLQQA